MASSDSSDASEVRLAPPEPAAEDLVPGYRLLRRLGRGAMAEVYLAEQCSLRRHVALKILRANLAVEQSYVMRFRLEAQAAASLVHPNIVQIYEVGCEGGAHFIAQEYVPGLNLREWLARHGTPQLPLALGVMRQVAAALAKASEHGIVHRDIKPDNIMVSSSGEVKVADFGLARLSTNDVRLTQEGFTLGTPLYMSPEQVEGRPLDTRSDIYSFGVTCYHMFTGQTPFAGETALQVAMQHLRSEPPPLARLRSDLPPPLCAMIHKMLAKQPEERFATAHEIIRSLRSIAAACGVDLDEHAHQTASGAMTSAAVSRQALTGQLQTLMRPAVAARRPLWRSRWRLALIVLVPFVVGLVAARWSRPDPLLSPHASSTASPTSASPTSASPTATSPVQAQAHPADGQATAGSPGLPTDRATAGSGGHN
ncbi:MAG TPA: serine/threonine-protein kinase [Pirellulales bacterium]